MANNSDIRPIYTELQGYLSQAPSAEKVVYLYDKSLWDQLNGVIDELNEKSGEDYSKFKITSIMQQKHEPYSPYILTSDYRSKLNGLIMRIYGRHFSEEHSPFGGFPSTVITQSQAQSQSVHVAMIMELQSAIDKKLFTSELEENEKGFLTKVKESLPTLKSFVEVINLVLGLAKSFGLSVDQVVKLFS